MQVFAGGSSNIFIDCKYQKCKSAARVSNKYYFWSKQQFCKDELCSCKQYRTLRTLQFRHKPSSVFNMRACIGFQMSALCEACTYHGPRLVVGLLSAISTRDT